MAGHRLKPLIKLWIVLINIGAISAALSMGTFSRVDGQSCTLPIAPFENNTFAGDFNAYAYAESICNLTCTDKMPLLRATPSLRIFLLRDKIDTSGAAVALQCFVLTAAIYTLLTIFLPTTPTGSVDIQCGAFDFRIPSKVVNVLLFKHSGIQGSIAATASLGVIFAEMYLPGFPEEDSAKTIGQWGSWAATMLLGVTAVVDHWLTSRKGRSRIT
jgi:hypothetical protein